MRYFWKVETTGTVFLSRIVRILLYCEQKIVPHLSVETVQVIFGYPSLAIREGRQYVQSQSFTSTAEIMAAMKEMFRDVIQQVMEVEMDEELEWGRCQRVTVENSSPNYRNAYSRKTVKPPLGEIDIRVPETGRAIMSRKSFDNMTAMPRGGGQLLALYACGMSPQDIAEQIKSLYDVEISPELVSKISEKIMPEVTAWQNRSLEQVYPFAFMDAIHYKVKEDHRYVTKAAYVVLGISMDGRKDILGVWIGEHDSSKFWLNEPNGLRIRSVLDVYLFCTDGLCGMMEAIRAVYPKSHLQRCIVHQIRSSTQYVSYKDIKNVVADLKKIYTYITLDEAEVNLRRFSDTWRRQSPFCLKSWEDNRELLSTFLNTGLKFGKSYTRLTYRGPEPSVPADHQEQTQLYQRRFSEENALSGVPADCIKHWHGNVRIGTWCSASCSFSSPTATRANSLPLAFPGGREGIHAASGAHTLPLGNAVIKGNKPPIMHNNCDILEFVESRLHKIFCCAFYKEVRPQALAYKTPARYRSFMERKRHKIYKNPVSKSRTIMYILGWILSFFHGAFLCGKLKN